MDNLIAARSEKAKKAFENNDFSAAAEGFQECLTLLEIQKDTINAAEMRNNLSVVLLELKKPDEALSMVQGTAQFFFESGDRQKQAMALGNQAAALQALGKLAESLSLYETSAEVFNEIHNQKMRVIILKKISDLQLRTGKQYQALASLEASYDNQEQKTIRQKVLKGFLRNIIQKLTG
ncbi:MAG: tetratricopeptide repeat protein [Chloroflexi bacterium]|nr:tetratricopeptide repeat protein [Chloroflexota bacterium]